MATLKEIRQRLQINQLVFADITNINLNTIRRIEAYNLDLNHTTLLNTVDKLEKLGILKDKECFLKDYREARELKLNRAKKALEGEKND